jgi:hypothetical protein
MEAVARSQLCHSVCLRPHVSYTACGAGAAYRWLAMGREGERQTDGRPGASPWRRRLAGRGERSSPGHRRRHTRTAVRAAAYAAPASRRAWGPPLHRAPGAGCDSWRGPRPARACAWDTSWHWGDPISDAGSRRPAFLSSAQPAGCGGGVGWAHINGFAIPRRDTSATTRGRTRLYVALTCVPFSAPAMPRVSAARGGRHLSSGSARTTPT